jgi:hypothetical protein
MSVAPNLSLIFPTEIPLSNFIENWTFYFILNTEWLFVLHHPKISFVVFQTFLEVRLVNELSVSMKLIVERRLSSNLPPTQCGELENYE